MSYSARAKQWINDSAVTQKKLAKEFHLTEAMFSNYLTGRSTMSVDVLVKIAKYFGLSMDYLVGLTDNPYRPMPLSESEQEMMTRFRRLNGEQQELLIHMIHIMQEQNRR